MLVKYVKHNLVNFRYCIIRAIFSFSQEDRLSRFGGFCSVRLDSRVLGLIFLHAQVSVGGFVNWSEIHRS